MKVKEYYDLQYLSHPGETVKELIENRDLSQNELARRMGVSAKQVSYVINGKSRITSSFAYKMAKAIMAEENVEGFYTMLTNLQSNHDYELLKRGY